MAEPMETVEVHYAINGTTKTDRFRCVRSRVQMWPGESDNGALGDVAMEGGSDKTGPVRDALYAQCYRIIRRIDEGNGS